MPAVSSHAIKAARPVLMVTSAGAQVPAAYPAGPGGDRPLKLLRPGRLAEGLRVRPEVVLGQHGTGLSGLVGQGTPAYLAAGKRKPGHRHRETRRIWPAHRFT